MNDNPSSLPSDLADAKLCRLVYVSRRVPNLSDDEVVDGIVLPAILKNRELEITGCLWFDHERFLQVLEGEPGRVMRLYDAICADPRHTAIDLVLLQAIESRSFPRFALRAVLGRTPPSVMELLLARMPGTGGEAIKIDAMGLVRQVVDDLASTTD